MARRPRLVPAVAAIIAVGLLLAGAVAWHMTAPADVPRCPANSLCFNALPGDHHLHPLRAELLWAGSALFALVAGAAGVRRYAQAASRVLSGARIQ